MTLAAKRDKERFVKACEALIVELGGTRQDGLNDWTIDTRFGALGLTARENPARDTGPGTVFTRFDDPTAAGRTVNCNPFSGKWNHHYWKGWTADAAFTDFAWQLRRIL